MSFLRRLLLRFYNVVRRGPAEQELAREVASHLALLEERFRAQGLTPDEARAAARRAFGGVEQAKEIQRDARSFIWLDDAKRDVEYTVRTLRRVPAFAAAAVVTIGLGVGANMAIFTLVNAVLLKTIPARNPGELVFLHVVAANGWLGGAPPYPCFEKFRDHSHAFSGLAAFSFDSMTLTIDGRAERALGQLVSGSYFDVLGIKPALGRTFVAADERDPSVAVLSYQYWQRRFGGDAGVLGRTIVYRDRPLTVIGVTLEGFMGLEPGTSIEVTVPITIVGEKSLGDPHRWWLRTVGRLAPGYSRHQALNEIDALFQAFMNDLGAAERDRFARMQLMPARHGLHSLREQFSEPLLLLMGTAAIVLLIACANVASLLLGRATARRHEFATRVAIGASRGRLARQLLMESLFLAAVGTCLGSILAYWLVGALSAPLVAAPFPITLDLEPDLRVLAFSGLLCLSTSLLFGLAPARRAGRVDVIADLKRGETTFSRKLILPVGTWLVVAQTALSLVLLVSMSLLVGTLASLRAVDAGFRFDDVTTMEVELLEPRGSGGGLSGRWTALVERIDRLPAVSSASLSWLTPLSGRHRGVRIRVPGSAPDLDGRVALNHVSPGYFDTMGIALRAGRLFTSSDGERAPRVAILNETAARFYFRGRSPIGEPIALRDHTYEIVGVAADTKHLSLRDEPPRYVYVPVVQPFERLSTLILAVRADRHRGGLATVRRELRSLGSEIVVASESTLEGQVDKSLVRERLLSMLSATFGTLGIVLATVGLFGVMSFRVLGRMREIAVRMALGASSSSVRAAVLRECIVIAAMGVLIGAPLSLVAARALSGLVFGAGPANVAVIGVCSTAMIVVAVVAGYFPARRASRVDPMTVLRGE